MPCPCEGHWERTNVQVKSGRLSKNFTFFKLSQSTTFFLNSGFQTVSESIPGRHPINREDGMCVLTLIHRHRQEK